jgi:hypothetical protein
MHASYNNYVTNQIELEHELYMIDTNDKHKCCYKCNAIQVALLQHTNSPDNIRSAVHKTISTALHIKCMSSLTHSN